MVKSCLIKKKRCNNGFLREASEKIEQDVSPGVKERDGALC